jgi:hypothetical protein
MNTEIKHHMDEAFFAKAANSNKALTKKAASKKSSAQTVAKKAVPSKKNAKSKK